MVPGQPYAMQFLGEERHVETQAVETGEITTAQLVHHGCADRLQGGRTDHIGIGDPVHGGGFGRDGHLRIHQALPVHLVAAGHHGHQPDLYDPITADPCSGGLQIEEHKGSFQYQSHGG